MGVPPVHQNWNIRCNKYEEGDAASTAPAPRKDGHHRHARFLRHVLLFGIVAATTAASKPARTFLAAVCPDPKVVLLRTRQRRDDTHELRVGPGEQGRSRCRRCLRLCTHASGRKVRRGPLRRHCSSQRDITGDARRLSFRRLREQW